MHLEKHHLHLNMNNSPPPGQQSTLDRWSLVFFFRPGNSVLLRALTDQSPLIAEAVKFATENDPDSAERTFNPGETAEEWFRRRVKYKRMNNWKVSL
jgi:hypothetical protein